MEVRLDVLRLIKRSLRVAKHWRATDVSNTLQERNHLKQLVVNEYELCKSKQSAIHGLYLENLKALVYTQFIYSTVRNAYVVRKVYVFHSNVNFDRSILEFSSL